MVSLQRVCSILLRQRDAEAEPKFQGRLPRVASRARVELKIIGETLAIAGNLADPCTSEPQWTAPYPI